MSNRYTKKAVTIEAVRFLETNELGPVFEGADEPPAWLTEALRKDPHEPGALVANVNRGMFVMTSQGIAMVKPGDWIIRQIDGELYPCGPDIFALTYDPAED